MKRIIERALATMLMVSVVVCMSACGASGEGGTGGTASNKVEGPKIEDIEWSVDEGISDGKRIPMLSITNNSSATIAGFEIEFTERGDLTDEERNTFFTDVKEQFELGDDDMAEMQDKAVGMHAETERVVLPGESISGIDLYYFQGYYYMRDMGHYSLVEPDIAIIDFVDGSIIYEEYYDFKSDKYTMGSEVENAQYWTTTELGTMIPKPEVPVLKQAVDNAHHFTFEAYGMSIEEFNSYVAQCKEKGFTVDPTEHDGFYAADNAEGYDIYANYYEDECMLHFSIDAPEEDSEEGK